VQVVEVDVVGPQPPQRRLQRRAHVLGPPVAAHRERLPGPRTLGDQPALRRERDLVAAAGERTAHQLLVGERAVHVGGVDERDAEVDRPVDDRDRAVVVAVLRGVGPAHAHAAEADRPDADVAVAETADGKRAGHAPTA